MRWMTINDRLMQMALPKPLNREISANDTYLAETALLRIFHSSEGMKNN